MNYNLTALYYHLQSLSNDHIIDDNDIDIVRKAFSSLTNEEILDFYLLNSRFASEEHENIDLVVTIPKFKSLSVNPTNVTVGNLLKEATKEIYITGYSISDYFDDFINVLIDKIKKGVLVKLFLNDFEQKEEVLHKLLLYSGKYLEVYNFNKSDDGIEALHAKVISVDSSKALITSANLSFNGLEKNIEIGTLICSSRISSTLKDTLNSLIKNKIVKRIKL